jgi:hypothetical protein
MIINTNTLLIIIIDFPFTYILNCLNIFNFTSCTLTSIILNILLGGISFYIFRGVKRGLKIVLPITGAAVEGSQVYLNYLQIQKMRRNRNIPNTDLNKDVSKDLPKDQSVDQKPTPKS